MRTAFGSLLILLISFAGCKEIKEKLLPSFTVSIPAIILTVPIISFKQDKEVPVGALRANINMDSTVRANTKGVFGASSVSSVKVTKVVFEVQNADALNNLSNFETGRLRLYPDSDTSAIDLAVIQFPQKYTDYLALSPEESPEIRPYLNGSGISYNIYWKNRRVTTKRLRLLIKITLSVQ